MVAQTLAPRRHYQYRKAKNLVMMGLTIFATVVTLTPLFLVLGYLLYKGASSINLAFFTRLPAPVGEVGGGMANAIVGTFELVLMAGLMGVPVGVGAGIYVAEHRGTRRRRDDGGTIDCRRHLRVRSSCETDGRLLDDCGRCRARDHHDSPSDQNHRRNDAAGAA